MRLVDGAHVLLQAGRAPSQPAPSSTKPHLRPCHSACQVYSLAFHQTMLEATAHATNKGLLLLALWRGFAMLWDAALQARGTGRRGGSMALSRLMLGAQPGPPLCC